MKALSARRFIRSASLVAAAIGASTVVAWLVAGRFRGQRWHSAPITALTFADGDLSLLTADAEGLLHEWPVAAVGRPGQSPLRSLTEREGGGRGLALVTSTSHVFAISYQSTSEIALHSNSVRRFIGPTLFGQSAITVLGDGRTCFIGGGDGVALFRSDRDQLVWKTRMAHGQSCHVEVNSALARGVSGGGNGALFLWDLSSGHLRGVDRGAHVPGGLAGICAIGTDSIATCGRDGRVNLWDWDLEQHLSRQLATPNASSMVWCPRRGLLLIGHDQGRVSAFVHSGLALAGSVELIASPPDELSCIAISANERLLAFGTRSGVVGVVDFPWP